MSITGSQLLSANPLGYKQKQKVSYIYTNLSSEKLKALNEVCFHIQEFLYNPQEETERRVTVELGMLSFLAHKTKKGGPMA